MLRQLSALNKIIGRTDIKNPKTLMCLRIFFNNHHMIDILLANYSSFIILGGPFNKCSSANSLAEL